MHSWLGGYSGYSGLKRDITIAWMTAHEHLGNMFFFLSVVFLFFYVEVLGHMRLPMGGILFHWKTQEWLCVLENATKTSISFVVSSKWVTIQF